MSESIEWIGAEHILAARASTPELHNKIIKICKDYEEHLRRAGQDCRAGQPTPGNKAGGLSTLDEKSLGCIRKGGTRPIVEVLEQAERPQKIGAMVMDTAGYDISSVTSMVASGAQIVVFTTGRGTPTGNAIVPVLKVTANENTYKRMEDNMDTDLSAIIRGEKTYQEMGKELLTEVLDICNGKMTKAEAFGFSDIAVDHELIDTVLNAVAKYADIVNGVSQEGAEEYAKVLETVRHKVHNMTAGRPLNRY